MPPKASTVLFGEGGPAEGDDPTGISDVVEAAEAEYEQALAEGDDGSIQQVDLTGDEDVDGDSGVGDDGGDDSGTGVADGDSGDDGSQGDEESGEDGDAAGDGDGDPADEGGSGEDEGGASLRFANHEAAEAAFNESREHINRLQYQLNQITGQLAQAPAPVAPAPNDLVAQASQDPVGAFRQALEHEDGQSAAQIIAQVSFDATQMAAQARIASEEGDTDQAALWEQRAFNASAIAEQMRHERMTADYEKQLAPMRERDFLADMSGAAHRAMQNPFFEGIDTGKYDAAIGKHVEENPHLMGDWSPAAMEKGFLAAAREVIDVSDIIAARVEAAVEARLAQNGAARPPVNKSRGAAGGAGRRTPAAPRQDSEADEVRNSVRSKIPRGMNVLFND